MFQKIVAEIAVDFCADRFANMAKIDNPEVDIPYYQRQMDSMAGELRERRTDSPLDALIEYLFVDNGFHGSRTDYYNRANSYISEVMDDREGLPISLAVIFLELANRIGLKDVVGVAAPGHFMVRHKEQLIDVFDGGKKLSRAEVEERVGAPLSPEYLRPASKREIVVRMLRNLQNAGSSAEAARYQELIEALPPIDGERVRTKNLP